jgi:hypothetical protein
MSTLPNLCGSDTCIWVFQSGTWTVQTNGCNQGNGCGCFDSTNPVPPLTSSVTGQRAVAPDVFRDKAQMMLNDGRLTGRKTKDGTRDLLGQGLPASNPVNGATYETPCVVGT